MNSEYMTSAKNFATGQREEYENSLAYLLGGLNEAKEADQNAANVRYENLLNKIRQQIPEIQNTFAKNAKAAYINKEQSLQQINADLNRLGVNTQGFGVTQRLLNMNAYGQAYGQLVSDLNDDLRDIANQETNALGDLNAELADIDASYTKDKLETEKYIKEQGEKKYESEYEKYYSDLQYQDKLKQQELENQKYEREYQDKLKQQEWENAFKEKQYKDQLKQQKFENDLALKQYRLSASRASSSGSSSKKTPTSKTDTKTYSTTYCFPKSKFSSDKAYSAYLAIIEVEMKNGGLSKTELNKLLNASSSLKTADKTLIKKQYGI